MTFRMKVENRGPEGATLHFMSGQVFDVEIVDSSDRIVWRLSHGAYFPQVLWDLDLTVGESSAWEMEWDLRGNDQEPLSPGPYMCRAFITCWPRDRGLVAEFSLTI